MHYTTVHETVDNALLNGVCSAFMCSKLGGIEIVSFEWPLSTKYVHNEHELCAL